MRRLALRVETRPPQDVREACDLPGVDLINTPRSVLVTARWSTGFAQSATQVDGSHAPAAAAHAAALTAAVHTPAVAEAAYRCPQPE
jgi:hypothetical protein